MSLAAAIDSFKTGTYTVTRYATGSYTAGRWAPGAPSTLNIDACIQPLTGRDLKILPEGRRADETLVLYTKTLLRVPSQGGGADQVSISGVMYEVIHVETWSSAIADTYYRVLAARVNSSGGP